MINDDLSFELPPGLVPRRPLALRHILVVDDDPLSCTLIRAVLEGEGYQLSFAQSGDEAFSQALELEPELILLDVLMRGMDGIETCRHIRAEPRLAEVPIIIMTALNERETRLRSIEAGADDFVTKPLDLTQLRVRVQAIMRLNRYKRLLDERDQRQRAEQETLRRNRELSLLNHVIRAAAAQPRSHADLARILHEACVAMGQVFELPMARAALLDEHGRYVLGLEIGRPTGEASAPLSLPLQQYVVPGEHPFVVRRPAHDARLAANYEALTDLAILLVVPVAFQRQYLGAWIELAGHEAHTLGARDLAFAQSIAAAVSQALANAKLHQQLQRYVETLEESVAQRTSALRAEHQRTRAILDALGEAVIVTDADGVISYINQAMLDLSGYRATELIGQNWQAIQPTGLQLLFRQISAHVQSNQIWRGELMGYRRDGSTYAAMMTVAPLYEDERFVGLVSIQRDISPLKAADRLKDQFISNISHELRTPLSVITLHSGNLATLYDQLSDARRRKIIAAIRTQADQLEQLIGDLIEMSRLDSGECPLKITTVDLAELLRSEIQHQQPLAAQKGQQLRAEGPQHLMIQGDEIQLRQVLRNLTNNAIKYTPREGRIVCSCAEVQGPSTDWPGSSTLAAGRWAGIRVADNGVGIAAEHLPQLFERFFRVENQISVPGTGLGLAITRAIVTRHGGVIEVASLPGIGSIFACYLPLGTA
ncbi:MAG: response regulator [Oscillochloridaceae bacterium umkhey_bin13]